MAGLPCQKEQVLVELTVTYNLCVLLVNQTGHDVKTIMVRTLRRGMAVPTLIRLLFSCCSYISVNMYGSERGEKVKYVVVTYVVVLPA